MWTLLLFALALPTEIVWKGESRPHLNFEIWEKTQADTAWVLVWDQPPNKAGELRQTLYGPVWVKARWRWDLWRTFLEPGATQFPPPPQTIYGVWSRPQFIPRETEPRPVNQPPRRVAVP